ncbi:hypothetical protein N0B16_10505 [Chryseobacterium sp. GMJ5]|uniref:Uncharacterized protein n=1 Tax=Chryseobacterium gilvum TaxID=2976534 RepID=A0ABT2VXZ4_9FLAO|nr:hypothetical protein [Chryseobacterium gilvum]MCU7614868.1 hypothetical protein [Chryseobacterium gilvum]
MNWIIRSTKTVKYHTNLQEVLKPIWEVLKEYNWVLTDLDFISDTEVPINFDHDYFILNHDEFEKVYNSETQIIWGIISAVPRSHEINLSLISKFSAENEKVWKPDQFLIPESFLEIIAFDSGYTIVKFRNKDMSNKFKNHFGREALSLKKFNEKYK